MHIYLGDRKGVKERGGGGKERRREAEGEEREEESGSGVQELIVVRLL